MNPQSPPLAPSERVAQARAAVFSHFDDGESTVAQFNADIDALIMAVSQAQDARIAELEEALHRSRQLSDAAAPLIEKLTARCLSLESLPAPPSDPTP